MATEEAMTEAELARLGLGGGRAIPSLRALGLWANGQAQPGSGQVIRALAAAANADWALGTLVRLAERRPEAWARTVAAETLLERVVAVAGTSDALGDLLVADPAALTVLAGDLEAREAGAVRASAASALDTDNADPARALAGFTRRGLLRIAARDVLALADTATISNELADLAEGVVAAALDHVLRAPGDARLAVIGMGKLGGRELNYVSDIDVVFVADGDLAAASKAAERLLDLLGRITPEGRVYEVDTNLRPEGRDGPLVRTLGSYAAYYERWAKTWEFQALLKARPVAGDRELGRSFAEMAGRFVWPDRLEAGRVAEIQRMKAAVEGSRPVRVHGARQLKLAPGGLRDIEFAVQLLQLVHGRHDEELRSPNTLEALAALADGGYVDDGDARLFSGAYQFLRTVEHRLQLRRLRRTHTVPEDDRERQRLARSVGFRERTDASALVQFDRELLRAQGYVRQLHEKLFYRPLLEHFAEIGAADHVTVGGRLDEDAARERLAALGFADPDGAMAHLDALASGLSRRARLLRTLLPAVLPTLAAAPDPDGGLAAFRSVADRLGDSPAFLRTLRDNPPVADLLARVLGSSQRVGQWLERQPEVFTHLSDVAGLRRRLEGDDYRRLTAGLLRRGDAPQAAGASLRRMKRREVARTAVRDLGGMATVTDVAVELTGLAEACLEAAVALAVPEGVRMAVVGLGRLGARELGYSSDLDALLVSEPVDARAEALQAAERLVSVLSDITPEGQAFHVDLNLRPEGKDGPLARSLESYRAYYERWAEPWELQALSLARPVAGDAELGEAFVEAVTGLVFTEPVPDERLQAIRRMKARVERERAVGRTTPARFRPRAAGRGAAETANRRVTVRTGDRIDVKLGPGGLSDVEWTVQLLRLRHGARLPALREPNTLAGIAALQQEGLLGAGEAAWLREGWVMLSRLRNVLYLMGARDSSTLPPGPREQEHAARILGYAPPGMQALAEDLSRTMRRVRKVHERCFYDA